MGLEIKLKELLEMTLEKLESEMGADQIITDIGQMTHLVDAAVMLLKWVPVSQMKSAKKTEIFERLEEYAMRLYAETLGSDCKYLSVECKLITICESEIDFHTRHSKKNRG